MIVLFCGIPGSGKTTIAGLLAGRLAALGEVQLLTSDRLRAPVYRKFFKALQSHQNRAEFLIFDATFYKKQWREQIEILAQREKVITVYLDCPLELALQRNRKREPNIAEKAVHIIFHQMEPPEHPALTIETAKVTASDAAEKIFAFIKDQQ
jgi:bifunctional enzyme CysN/CysC